jgi:hypothetical protein
MSLKQQKIARRRVTNPSSNFGLTVGVYLTAKIYDKDLPRRRSRSFVEYIGYMLKPSVGFSFSISWA